MGDLETWVQSLDWEDPLEKGKGYPLQYSGLENFMDYTVHGVTKSRTQLSDFHFSLSEWGKNKEQNTTTEMAGGLQKRNTEKRILYVVRVS